MVTEKRDLLGAAATAQEAPIATPATLPAVRALEAIRDAWVERLNELTTSVRALAVADDTYSFIVQPNFPYLIEHLTPDKLAAAGIDTIVLVDRKGKPLLWRRPKDPNNRGGHGFAHGSRWKSLSSISVRNSARSRSGSRSGRPLRRLVQPAYSASSRDSRRRTSSLPRSWSFCRSVAASSSAQTSPHDAQAAAALDIGTSGNWKLREKSRSSSGRNPNLTPRVLNDPCTTRALPQRGHCSPSAIVSPSKLPAASSRPHCLAEQPAQSRRPR